MSESIIEYIKNNGDIPTSSYKLSKMFGVSDVQIRKIINTARSNGCPICSNTNGYYYSENCNDIQKTINSLNHRTRGIQNAVNGLQTTLNVKRGDFIYE